MQWPQPKSKNENEMRSVHNDSVESEFKSRVFLFPQSIPMNDRIHMRVSFVY